MKIYFIKIIIIAVFILPLASCRLAGSDLDYDDLNDKVQSKDKSANDTIDPYVIKILRKNLHMFTERNFPFYSDIWECETSTDSKLQLY
jgi:hypothetical protein